uniref:Uncharacterized protein n=1 Tax=Anguilla anguilla TaxID=7936 RepID=A0A0E9SS93_ANGAN
MTSPRPQMLHTSPTPKSTSGTSQ